ncbi:MAG TPA: RNA polymerase sigma factor [Candidatus Elarobacter sp.]
MDSPNATIDAIWRIESPKLIAALTRILRDVGRAEELAQDAFVSALSQWPGEGIPRNPGAWLMTAAKRRAIDQLRRTKKLDDKSVELERALERTMPDDYARVDAEIDDDLLRLMFIAAHPVLGTEARVALTLRLLGGLTTAEIARAFLLPEPTIAQRIVRAKRTLQEANVPFELPSVAERALRLDSVLEAIYLIFNEGYAATAGSDVLRLDLVEEALRLGRVLAGLMAAEPEVHGLVALMELQASRMRARVDAAGDPVLLLDQDRARWNRLLIGRGLDALERAETSETALGPYALQAAIAACHARATEPQLTDWARIAALYDALAQVVPTPVVALNRAVAVGMAYGPQAGLELVDALRDEKALASYHLLPAVRGDLLAKLGRAGEAAAEFKHAAELAGNERDRKALRNRAAACGG